MTKTEFKSKVKELVTDANFIDQLISETVADNYENTVKILTESGDPDEAARELLEPIPAMDVIETAVISNKPERITKYGKVIGASITKAYINGGRSTVNSDTGEVTTPKTDWERTHYRLVVKNGSDPLVIVAGHRKLYQQVAGDLSADAIPIEQKMLEAIRGKKVTVEADVFEPNVTYGIEDESAPNGVRNKVVDATERHLVSLTL